MECEVAVVGAGIGGLTTAALLAKRGVDVCVFERNSVVGGCAANFEKFEHTFEPTYGLYTSFGPGQIYEHLFAELEIEPPEARRLDPAYVVRLPDGCDLAVGSNDFEEQLRRVFPECADEAVAFYRRLTDVSESSRRESASGWRRALEALRKPTNQKSDGSIAGQLNGLSPRFRRFLDAQLQTFAQVNTDRASYLSGARALLAAADGMYAIKGGAASLANKLAQSITSNGGRIRLNTPVLRLAYDSASQIIGLDLLSGERVKASRAMVSNLTIWDTYGKLVSLNRTPAGVRTQINSLRSHGSYLVFAGIDEAAMAKLPAEHIICVTDSREESTYDPYTQLMFASAPAWDTRAPSGKRAVVIHRFTDVDDWFSFHTDESEAEENDQRALEQLWADLHRALPELGGSIEVIDTANPRTFYENTRRKLGMVGGVPAVPGCETSTETSFPNLFIISDTAAAGGLSGLTITACALASQLKSPKKPLDTL